MESYEEDIIIMKTAYDLSSIAVNNIINTYINKNPESQILLEKIKQTLGNALNIENIVKFTKDDVKVNTSYQGSIYRIYDKKNHTGITLKDEIINGNLSNLEGLFLDLNSNVFREIPEEQLEPLKDSINCIINTGNMEYSIKRYQNKLELDEEYEGIKEKFQFLENENDGEEIL